ncbi:MAG: xanthine dehydrogenase family protein molybdopterin-binding subunit [Alphaproteobacteria bacterium]|nr:xanthine dehydrogenase family protein molybdopterin-binding subunit [Alphaproteobacteria bacterium]
MGQFGVGQAVRRKEDQRLLTGGGRYLDDMSVPNQAYAYILRSPHAHAKITSLDTTAARKAPGVLAVLTAADLETDKIGGIPCLAPLPSRDGKPMAQPPYPLLKKDRVRMVGDQVALVIAETIKQAKDAAELIAVDYDVLPAVGDIASAVKKGAPSVWDQADNRVFDWENGDKKAVDAAFAKAHHVTRVDLTNNRVVVNSMEPRGALGVYDAKNGRYTLYSPCQNVHMLQGIIAGILGVEKGKLRVVSPDVGGGFGMKVFSYVEQGLMPWAAKKVGRPVKWTSERTEAFISDTQGRDHVTRAELALDKDGKILAIRVQSQSNMGAYLSNFAPMIATMAGTQLLTGLYDIKVAYVNVLGVFTNTVPIDAYRGAGRPEASHVIERLVDTAAAELKMDPAELRRRNFIKPDQLPYKAPLGPNYDSGHFVKNMDDAIKASDWVGFAKRKAEAEKHGKLRGIGMSCYVEAAIGSPNEDVELIFEQDGSITLLIGTLTNGQGHATSYSQVLEEMLGLPFDRIKVVQGDTDVVKTGGGTGGSRSMMIGASAIKVAADKVIEKGRKIAAHMLEAAESDIEFADGVFRIVGTDRRMSIGEVAAAARNSANVPKGMEPSLDTKAKSDVAAGTYPNGCHVCEVEIDKDTGVVKIVGYTVVDDFGKVVNPVLIAGQVHGGIVQGVGQALLEHCIYDPESAQLLTGSFMDYAMPRADNVPSFRLGFNEVLCKTNPLGIKGAGEAGTVGALGAVMNAIVDALKGYGVKHVEMPATPERIWRTIHGARAA